MVLRNKRHGVITSADTDSGFNLLLAEVQTRFKALKKAGKEKLWNLEKSRGKKIM